ncbi:MAG: PD-(D/E)XK nuclease family protein [Verrucomicrobia bacterium]|nr:PD-(D/E)XK nuclease family protein [Verrucomicrobiota bacterium]
MPIKRTFLGWDAPLTQTVPTHLMRGSAERIIDLGDTMVIVPTRQAGRRLRQALAKQCLDVGRALLSPSVDMPNVFLRTTGSLPQVDPLMQKTIWSQVLLSLDLREFPALFPVTNIPRDNNWAFNTGAMIQKLRDDLADGGYRIADVASSDATPPSETDRWRDLKQIEAIYLKALGHYGYADPSNSKIDAAQSPHVDASISRILVASVPDPSLLFLKALGKLAEQLPIEILIAAPDSEADHFDEWGRPKPDHWNTCGIDLEDYALVLCSSPSAQAKQVLQEIAVDPSNPAPGDISVGVPDRDVIPSLTAEFAQHDVTVFDPAEKALSEHPLAATLAFFCQLCIDPTYRALRNLIRQADVLDVLTDRPENVLTALDTLQNDHLPATVSDVVGYATGDHLPPVLEQIRGMYQLTIDKPVEGIRTFLQAVYGDRKLAPHREEDAEFLEAAKKVNDAIDELQRLTSSELGLKTDTVLDSLILRLGEIDYPRDRRAAKLDLEGWLELPWNDAPLLLVTGMNEGHVPDSQLNDVFIPDSLRRALKLRDDAFRLARDSYLMTFMIESRRESGRARFLCGKTSSTGDPLRPSRLLFRCPDKELPQRSKKLFGEIRSTRYSPPSTVSFKLSPHQAIPKLPKLEKLSVTAFSAYLACPFRFLLSHQIGMEELDDSKREMDALDFGTMAHRALQKMAEDEKMVKCTKPEALAEFLSKRVEEFVHGRYGSSAPLPVRIAAFSAQQRLAAAARVHVNLVEAGWTIIASEKTYSMDVAGVEVRGKIDRIDRGPDGEIMIIDYKTSDTARNPADTHLGKGEDDLAPYASIELDGKPYHWTDLQIPLYHQLAMKEGLADANAHVALFNLPKAISAVKLDAWEDFSPEISASALAGAEGIIERIKAGVFWPPAERIQYDDFELLFPAEVVNCVDEKSLEKLIKESAR